MSCHVGSTHPTAHGLAFQCSSRRCWGDVDGDGDGDGAEGEAEAEAEEAEAETEGA